MDNTKLLRMIGTTLGTLAGKIGTALAESRPPCGVPCATGHCTDNTAGVCTGPETCAADGAITPCNEPCGHSGCTHTRRGLCTSAKTCYVHVPAEKSGPCYRHACIQQGERSVCYAVSFCENRIPEELLQDYTLTQWDEIRKGGYLCQFAPDDHFHPEQTLLGHLNSDMPVTMGSIFYSEYVGAWSQCRPAQIPGVLRPWFGGDCPVDRGAKVLAIFKDKDSEIKEAGRLGWGRIDQDETHRLEIIAYMEV